VKRPGRPRTSKLTRAEQLRRAKRAQRDRDQAAGLVQLQLKLPRPVAAKLAATARIPGFAQALDVLLDDMMMAESGLNKYLEMIYGRGETTKPLTVNEIVDYSSLKSLK